MDSGARDDVQNRADSDKMAKHGEQQILSNGGRILAAGNVGWVRAGRTCAQWMGKRSDEDKNHARGDDALCQI